MKKTALLAAAAVMAIAVPAFAAEDTSAKTKVETSAEQKADGSSVEKKTSETAQKDAAGTETKESTTQKSEVDANGNVTKSTETKTTVDPEGMMNQKTTETSTKEEIKDGKHKIKHVKKVNGKTVVDEEQDSKPQAQ
jgi:hypothetical protein